MHIGLGIFQEVSEDGRNGILVSALSKNTSIEAHQFLLFDISFLPALLFFRFSQLHAKIRLLLITHLEKSHQEICAELLLTSVQEKPIQLS